MAHAGTQWYLVDRGGKKIQLPQTMIFLGREDCDIKIQVRRLYIYILPGCLGNCSEFSTCTCKSGFTDNPGVAWTQVQLIQV